jgi:hypothetical protein
MERLLYPGGQALLALPIRGAFYELLDLLREYVLKHDDGELAQQIEHAFSLRPTAAELSAELEAAGLDDIAVTHYATELTFESARAFTEDPAMRLLVLPEIAAFTDRRRFGAALSYVREAIDRYWSESEFSLTVHIGAASARKH